MSTIATSSMHRVVLNEDGSISLEPEAVIAAREATVDMPDHLALRLVALRHLAQYNRLLRDRRTARQFWIDQGYIDGREA